jgi:AcrR family transcriptional regulator
VQTIIRGRGGNLTVKLSDRYHHGDLRQMLVGTGLAEVERVGAEAVSLAALAKSLGVSQAAPYRHFADREALLAAVAEEGFKSFAAALKTSIAGRSKRPALLLMAQAYVAFGLRHNGVYRLMFASRVLPNTPNDSALRNAAQQSFSLLVQTLPQSESPQAAARRALRIWTALHGVVMLAEQGILSGAARGVSLKALVEEIVS